MRGSSVSAEADDAAFDSQYTIGEDGNIEAIPMLNPQVDQSLFIFTNSAQEQLMELMRLLRSPNG